MLISSVLCSELPDASMRAFSTGGTSRRSNQREGPMNHPKKHAHVPGLVQPWTPCSGQRPSLIHWSLLMGLPHPGLLPNAKATSWIHAGLSYYCVDVCWKQGSRALVLLGTDSRGYPGRQKHSCVQAVLHQRAGMQQFRIAKEGKCLVECSPWAGEGIIKMCRTSLCFFP